MSICCYPLKFSFVVIAYIFKIQKSSRFNLSLFFIILRGSFESNRKWFGCKLLILIFKIFIYNTLLNSFKSLKFFQNFLNL